MLTAAMPRTQVAATEHGPFLPPQPHRAAGFTHHRPPNPKEESPHPPREQNGSEAAWTRVGTPRPGARQTPLVLGPSHTPLNEARGLINQCLGGEQSLINHCH